MRRAAPTVLRVTADEAVKMALENNLGVQADRLGPQIETYGVAQARAAYGLNLTSSTTTRSATSPPTDFITTGAGTTVNTADSFRTGAGVQQLVPWGGGRYTLGLDASRLTSNDPTSSFNPQLDSSSGRARTRSHSCGTSRSTRRGRTCCRVRRTWKSPMCNSGRR